MTNPNMEAAIEEIARHHLFIQTLERRNSDELDFHDLSVWGVKAALQAAYEAGKKEREG